MTETSKRPLLVIGAGISGITAALEAAEAGKEVVLVEREPAIGGRVAGMFHYFPKMCPPSCGLEINLRRLERSPNVRVLVGTEVAAADETGDGFSVTLRTAPRYVNDRCTACGECVPVCPGKTADTFNYGMAETTAIRLSQPNAWPRRYTLTRSACPDGCTKCVEACAYEAIDLAAQDTEEKLEVSAIVVATGWAPYPLENIPELGGGKLADVVANVQMERLASPSGPTAGKILRPSDGKPPAKVAFVQCAGSRDVNHLPYCSAVCCLASLKQAIYVKEQLPEAEVTIYYIDRRTPGRNEDVLNRVAEMDGVRLVKGKVGSVTANGGGLRLRVEDVEADTLLEADADLVVLATGMMPSLAAGDLPLGLTMDEDSFAIGEGRTSVAGVARRPEDVAASVRDATGAAARAVAASGREA